MSNCPLPHPLTVMLYMSVREPVTLPQQHSGGFLKCVLHLSFTTKWQNGSQLFCHFSRSLSLTWNQELIPPHLHNLPVRFRMISPGLWWSMVPDSPMEPGFITSWELNGDFGAPLTRTWHLPLCIVDALETTCQGHSCAPWWQQERMEERPHPLKLSQSQSSLQSVVSVRHLGRVIQKQLTQHLMPAGVLTGETWSCF